MKPVYLLSYLLVFCSASVNAGIRGPLEFIENKGQWDEPFMYKTSTMQGDIFFLPQELVYVIEDPVNHDKIEAMHHGLLREPQTLRYHEYRVHFENAGRPLVTGNDPIATYYNYFLGSDKSRWQGGIHPCRNIDYTGLYNGINMHISSSGGSIKYDFIVAPGANASQIKLRYEGADNIRINDKGNLIIETSVGNVQELKPYAYQDQNGKHIEVPCNYQLDGDTVTYIFPRGYSGAKQLIIDPAVVFSTYTGSVSDNFGYTATYDKHGNFYAGGVVHSVGYPVNVGAFQVTFGGGSTNTGMMYETDMGLIKFSPDGTNRIWATYLGGADNEQPLSLIVDSSDNLVVLGRSYSNNFPFTTGCYDSTYNGGADLTLTKFNSAGSSLMASSYIGGSADDGVNGSAQQFIFDSLKYNFYDDVRSEVILDDSGNVYVASCSQSANFPISTTATQNFRKGVQDAVVFKFNPGLTSLTWSTYLGGSKKDAAYTLALNENGTYLYVAGGTDSSGIATSPGALDATYQGGMADGFIVRFENGNSYSLQKATYIGTSNYDQCFGIKTDLNGAVYTMGQSLGGQFPVTPGVYSNPLSSQFIMKLDSNLSTDIFSTVYGSGDSAHTNISPLAFFVDSCENIYISGWGGVVGAGNPPSIGTTTGMAVTANAIQTTTDGNDHYVIVFGSNASNLLYATFFGSAGTTVTHSESGTSRFDKHGVLYQSVCAGCAGESFPTQPPNVWSLADSSFNCNQVALKIDFNQGPVICGDTTTIPNRVNRVMSSNNIVISPNPSNGHFSITMPDNAGDARLSVMNTLGQRVLYKELKGNNAVVDIPRVPGIYFVKLNAGGVIYTSKIVIE